MLICTFRSGSFFVSVYDSLDHEIEHKWSDTIPGPLNQAYLQLIEESKPADLQFRYVIVELEDSGVRIVNAKLYFQILKFTKRNIKISNSVILDLVTSAFLFFRPFKILICGNVFAVNFPAIIYDQKRISREIVLEIISEIMNKINADAYFLKDMAIEFNSVEMEKLEWKFYPADMTMSLKINSAWLSIEDYFSKLAKNYRKRAKKIRSAGHQLSRRELDANEINENIHRIGELFKQVSDKQTIRMGLLGPDYFYKFSSRFKDSFSFVGYYIEERLIGFATYIDHGETLEIHYIGIDYDLNKRFMIYFNILLDGVEMAIRKRKKILELGRTAREAKASLGADAEYFNDYFKIRSPIISRISERFLRMFQADVGEDWKERHPFREIK